MKLLSDIRIGLLQREIKLNLILKFGPNRINGFREIAVERFYFIVFANILIKLMRKIGKKWA